MSNLRPWIRWVGFSLGLAFTIHLLQLRVLGHQPQRTLVTDIVQGIIAGAVLSYFTANFVIGGKLRAIQTTVNGWRTTTRQRGEAGQGLLLRAAYTKDIAALNVPEEQVYWEAFTDGAGQKLDGRRDYVLHFPPGGLPPNEASWSLTVGDSGRRMVENPIHRYSVGGRSGLVPNADGSLDIHLQHAAPAVGESNWLPVPARGFMLWLRVYQPGPAILSGAYQVPAVAPKAAS